MANRTAPIARSYDLKYWIVTGMVAIVAVCLVWPQIFPGPAQEDAMNLPKLEKRAAMLRQITDPIQRDRYCVGLSALGRQLNAMLQPDARVYVADMLGPTNVASMGYYYFLRNYLFPRDVEISMGKTVFGETGANGIGSDSPDVLKSNGFDIVIAFPNNQIQVLPLTPKGVLKQ